MTNVMIKASELIALFRLAYAQAWGYIMGAAGIKWTQAAQQAKINYMVQNYGDNWKTSAEAKKDKYYYSAKDGAKWIGKIVADCSGLFKWAFKKLGGDIYHGSNTIWNKYCSSQGELSNGRRTDGQDLKPGTAVFVNKLDDKGRKTNNRSHIGLYVGDGLVIEAQGTNAGVVVSKVTLAKWNEWGELSAVIFDTPENDQGIGEPASVPGPVPSESDESGNKPTLRKGDKGAFVMEVQMLLIQHGFSLPRFGADGDFGSETLAAVKAFQKSHGLAQDGIVGKNTWSALIDSSSLPDPAQPVIEPVPQPELYMVIIPHLPRETASTIVSQYSGSWMEEERG